MGHRQAPRCKPQLLTMRKREAQAEKLREGGGSLTPGDEETETELRFLGFLWCHSRRIENHLKRFQNVFLPQLVEPAE